MERLTTQQNIARDDAITAIRFPIRLLTIALVLTTAAFAWFGWIILDERRGVKMFQAESLRTEELRGVIVHLDEMLTMSARMAAATGDSKWEERYRRFEPQLDVAIKETTKLGTTPRDSKAAAQTDEANTKLVEMENRAFALVRAGRKEEAQAVVFSPEYEAQKKIYAEGIESFNSRIRREADEHERRDKRIGFVSMIGAVVVLAISIAAWLSVVRSLQRWRTALEKAVSERKQADQALRRVNDDLEARIEQRTAELARTNQDLEVENAERKRAEEALRESEEQFRAKFELASVGIAQADPRTGQWLLVNQKMCEITGYAAAEMLQMLASEITHPEDRQKDWEKFEQVVRGEAPDYRMEKRYIRKDGTLAWVNVNMTIIRDSAGQPTRTMATIEDITERKRTEEQIRVQATALDAAANAIVITDHTGTIEWVNRAFTALTGYTAQEAVGQNPRVLKGGKEDEAFYRNMWQTISSGQVWSGELTNRRKDGSLYEDAMTITPLRNAAGVIIRYIAIKQDITERKQAEAALSASEERFRIAAETANDVIYEWDLKQSLEWLGNIDDLLGYEPGEFPRTLKGWADSVHPEDLERTMAAIQAHLEGRGPYAIEYRVRRKDGVYRWWSARGAVARTPDGKPTRWIGSITDITERKQAEESLRESERRYQSLAETSPAGVFRTDPNGATTYVNARWCELAGLSAEEALGDGWLRAIHPEDREGLVRGWREASTSQGISQADYRLLRRDGSVIWVLGRAMPDRDAAGRLAGYVGTITDITERKQVEEQIERLSRFPSENPHPVLRVSAQGVLQYANAASDTLLPTMGAEVGGAVNAEWRARIGETLAKAHPVNIEFQAGDRTFGATLSPVVNHGYVSVYARDITGRKRAEAALEQMRNQLLAVSRQAGIAEFATGVLHNVGNVLTSVNVAATSLTDSRKKSRYVELARVVALMRQHEADLGAFLTHDPKGKQVFGFLAQLAERLGAEQVTALEELRELRNNVDHLKSVISAQQDSAKMSRSTEALNLTDLVEDALKMNVNGLQRSGIHVIKEFEELPPIVTEKHMVLQVLVNLVANAMQAFDASGGQKKRLTLHVSQEAGRVRVAVADNGSGILPENLPRIFTHGFTTKEHGHGFGLHSAALAAKEMGGSLSVHSDGPGQGATFTLELPCPTRENSHE